MIDLHERLSDFSYGYGVTREAERLLKAQGLDAAPFLPNLIHEAELGYDVKFNKPGGVVMLQFKLGQRLMRYRGPQLPDHLERPYWRFKIDTNEAQYQKLLASEAGTAQVFYVAPRFSDWEAYDAAYRAQEVIYRSLLIAPSDIQAALSEQGMEPGPHRIVYDSERRYVCSDPVAIRETTPTEMVEAVLAQVRLSSPTLGERVSELAERARASTTSPNAFIERREFAGRTAKSTAERDAIEVGLDAWCLGIQTIFVTEG